MATITIEQTLNDLTWARDTLKGEARWGKDAELNALNLIKMQGTLEILERYSNVDTLPNTSLQAVRTSIQNCLALANLPDPKKFGRKMDEALVTGVLTQLLDGGTVAHLFESLELLFEEIKQLLNPQPQVEAEEVTEEVTLTPEEEAETFFSEISEKYENGLSSTQNYLEEGFDYFVEIKNDKIKRSLSKIESTIHAIKGERFKYWQIDDRRVCTSTLINGADDLITYDFGESFADLLKAAKIECDIDTEVDFDEYYEYEENYDELCARIDTFVHDEFIDIDEYLIAQNIQDATSDIYDFDFVTRLSSEMAKDNFEPVGFIYNYCNKLNEMLEEFMDDLKRYLNLAIQEALKLQSRMQVKGE